MEKVKDFLGRAINKIGYHLLLLFLIITYPLYKDVKKEMEMAPDESVEKLGL